VTNAFRRVFWSAGFGWMFDAMDVGLLSFVIVMLRNEWQLTPGEAGMLGTFNMLGMAFGASLGGLLADRFGRRPVFLSTLAVFGLASFGSAAATGFGAMLAFRFVMGLGLGAELPVASTLVNEFAPERHRGRAVVLLESFWAAGWIAAAIIAYYVMPAYGWRAAVVIGSLPALYAFFIRNNIPESPAFRRTAERPRAAGLFTAFRNETIALWSVWFAISFSYYGMFLWLPSILVEKGYTVIQSFSYVLWMTAAQLPGYFAAAYLIEKLGRKWTLSLFLLLTAAAAFGFGESESVSAMLAFGALLSFSNLGAWGALYAYTPENYPASVRASGSGFAAAFGRLGSVAAPWIVGALMERRVGYGTIFGMFTVVLAAGVIALVLLGKETKPSFSWFTPDRAK